MQRLAILCVTILAQEEANVVPNHNQDFLVPISAISSSHKTEDESALKEEQKGEERDNLQPRKLEDNIMMVTPDEDPQPNQTVIIQKEQGKSGGLAVGLGVGMALAAVAAAGAFVVLNGQEKEEAKDPMAAVETSKNLVPLVAMSLVTATAAGFAGYSVYKNQITKLPELKKEIKISGFFGLLGTMLTRLVAGGATSVLSGFNPVATGIVTAAHSVLSARPHYLHLKQNTWETGIWNIICLTIHAATAVWGIDKALHITPTPPTIPPREGPISPVNIKNPPSGTNENQ